MVFLSTPVCCNHRINFPICLSTSCIVATVQRKRRTMCERATVIGRRRAMNEGLSETSSSSYAGGFLNFADAPNRRYSALLGGRGTMLPHLPFVGIVSCGALYASQRKNGSLASRLPRTNALACRVKRSVE